MEGRGKADAKRGTEVLDTLAILMKAADRPGVLGKSGVFEREMVWNGGVWGWKLGSEGVGGRDCWVGGGVARGEEKRKAAMKGRERRILA